MTSQFSVRGMQCKHFDDGVEIAVDYTRHNLNVTHINSIRYSYNLEYMEVNYNCRYIDFIHSNPKICISKNMVDVAPRVRQMMDQVESELKSVVDAIIGQEEPISANITVLDDNGRSLVDAINYDGTINLEAIGVKTQTSKPPAPKRQRTRWELLELD